jgi:hypothetical protein
MKTYVADPGQTIVWVMFDSEDEMHRAYTLPHHVKHSPDGFSWGYGGSGPSELARCILLDLFGDDHEYQAFKFAKIATRPMDEPFSITEEEVREWRAECDAGIVR